MYTEYYDAYEEVTKIDDFYMEMSREDAGVLCGLIREFAPKKIMEIGVAAGGSTCLIMKTLEKLGGEYNDAMLYSLDASERFYRNEELETGYLWNRIKNNYENAKNHQFLLGKLAVDRMEEIAEIGGIDFLFLDTVHALPGELLDFLLLLPYLSKNAIVVLHDTILHNRSKNRNGKERTGMANRVLLSSVTANKFYRKGRKFLNIGAFQICEDTKKYIKDVFGALLLPWCCCINNDVLKKYDSEYRKNYAQPVIDIWEDVIEEAAYVQRGKEFLEELDKIFKSESEVYIYGCGYLGNKIYNYIKEKAYRISGLVVSDGICKEDFKFEEEIYYFSEIEKYHSNSIIIVATMSQEVEKLLGSKNIKHIPYDQYNWIYI